MADKDLPSACQVQSCLVFVCFFFVAVVVVVVVVVAVATRFLTQT